MTAPLRVAVLARSVFPLHGVGGLERHVYDLVRHLAESGTQVTLITKVPTADDKTVADALGHVTLRTVPYTTFPFAGQRWTTILDRDTAYPLFGERAGRLAAQLVHEGTIDIVHGLGASALGYARRRAEAGAPLVLNPQGLEEFGATDPGQARLKRAAYLPLRRAVLACARAADRVIATDRALEPAVLEHLQVPRDKVRLVPNAIDLDAIDQISAAVDSVGPRSRVGIARDDVVLLSVGRLEANKGFHVLADALGALRAHGAPLHGNWRWVLVGDGPYRGAIQQAIAAAQLDGHVLLRGRVSDDELHAWYDTATLFVHPTLYEGSSLVTLEAMAHRRAVVATRAGGLPDKVRHNETGWLVDPGRPDQLAAAISGALARPERLSEMGRAGRALAEEEFAWPAVTRRLLDVYRELRS
jgi:glycosyltransferase involved in cell wall biosynthesis